MHSCAEVVQFVSILVPFELEDVDRCFRIEQLELVFSSFLTLEKEIFSWIRFPDAIEKVDFVRYVVELLITVILKMDELSREYLCILVTKIENGAIVGFDVFILYGVSLGPLVEIKPELEYVAVKQLRGIDSLLHYFY